MKKSKTSPNTQDFELDYDYQAFHEKHAQNGSNKPINDSKAISEKQKEENLKLVLGLPEDFCLYCNGLGYWKDKQGTIHTCMDCAKKIGEQQYGI